MASSRTLRLFAVLGLLGLSGCASDEALPLPCVGTPTQIPAASPPGIVLVGRQARLPVMPTLLFGCRGQEVPHPTSVTAEVEGPNGEQVTSQIELGGPGSPAVLQFTPERPGPHHILVAFSQVGGLHQFDLHAALDRSAESSSQSLPVVCESLERTLQGAWACDSAVLRDGAFVAAFSSARLAVAGDVIWAVDGGYVRRYLDTGAASLVLTGSFPHQKGGAEFLVAAADELVVLHTNALVLYTFKDGAVTSGGAEPWARPGSTILPRSPYGVLLREGDRLAVATRSKIALVESAVQVCPYQLLSGRFQRTPGDCPLLPGEIAGLEPGVLWTRDQPSLSGGGFNPGLIRRWVWTGGEIVEQGSMSPGPNTHVLERPLMRSAAAPLLRDTVTNSTAPPVTAVLTWSPQKKMILLEHLDSELTEAFASPTLYWGRQPTAPAAQPTKVRLRPPPP